MNGRPAFVVTPGFCVECGCSEHFACIDPATGLGCSWANAEETLCSVCAFKIGEQIEAIALAVRGLEGALG